MRGCFPFNQREGSCVEAAEARDEDGLLDAGNLLIDSCEGCHEVHLRRE